MATAAAAARDGQTALALRLAKHLAPGGDDRAAAGNVVFSPVSVHAALALVAASARGATLAQLLAFLGAPSAEELAEFGCRVADRVLADRSYADGPRVLFGGGIWVDASRGGLTQAFRDVAAESYKSEAQTVSFAEEPEAAVTMINEWVKKATGNLIDTIISTSDIDAATDLVLANAVYFKGQWLHPFNPYFTERGAFHCLDGSLSKVEFMTRGIQWLHMACLDGFKVLKLPYKPGFRREQVEAEQPTRGQLKRRRGEDGTQYSMFVFLPDARDGISTMVDVITAAPAFLYSILAEMKEKPVDIKLPKFNISFNWNGLGNDLRRLGLSLPFSAEAGDLRGMCEEDGVAGRSRRPTFLSKVAHKAIVKVNEVGTEAAAVTVGLSGGGGPPPDLVEFVADHSFTFFIMEERSGVIVFAGHVLDPAKCSV